MQGSRSSSGFSIGPTYWSVEEADKLANCHGGATLNLLSLRRISAQTHRGKQVGRALARLIGGVNWEILPSVTRFFFAMPRPPPCGRYSHTHDLTPDG